MTSEKGESQRPLEQNGDVLLSFLNGGKGTHNSPILQVFPRIIVKNLTKKEELWRI